MTVGYVQRLRDELGSRAWVTSYTNQAQGYIPTQLLIDEGGYEGGDINIIAGHPARYADVRAATAARLCRPRSLTLARCPVGAGGGRGCRCALAGLRGPRPDVSVCERVQGPAPSPRIATD